MWKNRNEYIRTDDYGRVINSEFPPESFNKYPNNDGYRTANLGMLFYWYAVQYYDILIEYKGDKYIFLADDTCCSVCMYNDINNQIGDDYPTANDLIKNFKFIDGRKLIDVIKTNNIHIGIY